MEELALNMQRNLKASGYSVNLEVCEEFIDSVILGLIHQGELSVPIQGTQDKEVVISMAKEIYFSVAVKVDFGA